MLRGIFKQYRLPWIGGFKEMLAQTVFYISMINFVLIAITAYNTTLRTYLQSWIPSFQLWMFFLALVTLVFLIMIVEYKFIAPSLYSFRSRQMFEHESKIMDILKRIEGRIGKAENVKDKQVVVAVSGGFDPVHPGHLRYIEEAKKLGDYLLVILTRDEQLIEKDRVAGNVKKRSPIPYDVRKSVLEWGLGNRGEVVMNIDKDITSCMSLRRYHPDIFAKGGDSWDLDNLPEKSVCDELGIKIVFGVGGYDKPYSSSKLGVGVKE